MEIFNENREELNQNIELLESKIDKLKDKLLVINFINKLNLNKEDFKKVLDFKVEREFNESSGGEYCLNQDGFFKINYTYKSEKPVIVNFRVDYEYSQSYHNRYEPDINLEPRLNISGIKYKFNWSDRKVESLEKTKKCFHLINKILSRYEDEDEDYNFWTDLMVL